MQISLSPVNYYKNTQFKSRGDSKKETPLVPTKKQIYEAKTKKAASECFWVALAFCIIAIKVKASSDKIGAEKINEICKKRYNFNQATVDYYSEMAVKELVL